MRIPSYAVLVFSALLLVGVVHGANITIGHTQGHVEYRVTIINQGSTVSSFFSERIRRAYKPKRGRPRHCQSTIDFEERYLFESPKHEFVP